MCLKGLLAATIQVLVDQDQILSLPQKNDRHPDTGIQKDEQRHVHYDPTRHVHDSFLYTHHLQLAILLLVLLIQFPTNIL
ncbi:hypothetical protein DJ94_3292 [Bacillus pseudomycoides]|nr:hypothetical protein DJ94_3292 [Bacillus pseudomycoides]